MDRIVLTRKKAELTDVRGRAFAIVAPGYEAPCGVEAVTLDAVLADPERWCEGGATMVIVGLSRLMTPSNRVKLGRVLLRPRAGLRRISVDELLFVSEPWRLWWHFYAVGAAGHWGLTDSFLAETRWNAAVEMQTPDPFGVESVSVAAAGVVRAIDPFVFQPVAVDTIPATKEVHAAYSQLKETLFTHEKTVAAIIKRLAAFAQASCPDRAVPSSAQLFKKPPARIVRTDLAVDTFLVGQLLDRIRLTNAIAGTP